MQEYRSKAKRGVTLLMTRQGLSLLVSLVGGIILARVLRPEEFGLYVIAMFLVSTFALIGDFGMAPSFIQRKAELTDHDICVGFTIQQVLTTAIVILLFVFAPLLARLYPKAPPETVWFVRALSFNLYLTSWHSMSAVQLERHLNYDQLARIELLETVTFQAVAVTCALLHLGTWSYVAACLAQGFLGTALIYLACPWRVGFAFDRKTATELARFGGPFQLQLVLNSFGTWVTPLLVGGVIGPGAVGFLTWASNNGRKPVNAAANVMRVAFPHFSRIQHDREEVQRMVSSYLNWLLLAAGLWLAVVAAAGYPIVEWVYKPKWLPAVPALVLLTACVPLELAGWLVVVALNGMGRVGVTTRFFVIRSLINVAMAMVLVMWTPLRFNGVPVAFLLANLLTIPPLVGKLAPGALRRIARNSAWILVPTGVAVASGLCLAVAARMGHARASIMSCLLVPTVVLTYFSMAWATGPQFMRQTVVRKLRFLGQARVLGGAIEPLADPIAGTVST